MATNEDRGFKQSVTAIVKNELPPVDYYAFYRAKVVAQSGDFSTVDLQPDDSRLPGLSSVPLRHGLPNMTAQVTPGTAYVMVGWDGGDPSKPFAALWGGGETVIQLNITATTIDIKANGNATLEATGAVTVKGASATKLGAIGTLPVLVQGTVDSLGVPVTQNPAASATTVLAG